MKETNPEAYQRAIEELQAAVNYNNN